MTTNKMITVDMLKAKGAYCDQLDLFNKLFPNGIIPTKELCIKHALNFDWDWAANNLLSFDEWKIYEESMASALKIYEESVAPAKKNYQESIALARKIYEESVAIALDIYKKSTVYTKNIYDESVTPAWKIYQESKAIAWFEAWERKMANDY